MTDLALVAFFVGVAVVIVNSWVLIYQNDRLKKKLAHAERVINEHRLEEIREMWNER